MIPEQVPADDRSFPKVDQKPTAADLLLEQYKLLENRRQYFGNQFMQTVGGVAAIFSVLVGLLSGKPGLGIVFASTLTVGGVVFVLLALLAYRLGGRQDDCEKAMQDIESHFRDIGYARVARMPHGRSFGARKIIVFFLAAFGISLFAIGIIGLGHTL